MLTAHALTTALGAPWLHHSLLWSPSKKTSRGFIYLFFKTVSETSDMTIAVKRHGRVFQAYPYLILNP